MKLWYSKKFKNKYEFLTFNKCNFYQKSIFSLDATKTSKMFRNSFQNRFFPSELYQILPKIKENFLNFEQKLRHREFNFIFLVFLFKFAISVLLALSFELHTFQSIVYNDAISDSKILRTKSISPIRLARTNSF